jgi:hypothetical protein
MSIIKFNTTAFERFWSKVNKDGPIPEHRPELGRCWVWTGQINSVGYGVLQPASYVPEERTHRVSWTFAYGEIPDGFQVLHRCDQRFCVNPLHLRLGTRDDNSRDMATKFRASKTKLDIEAVRDIRLKYAHRVRGTVTDLSDKYGIHRSEVRRVAKGLIFRDVDADNSPDDEFIAGSGIERPPAMDGSQIEFVPLIEKSLMDLTGHTYSRLTPRYLVERVGHSDAIWLCDCSCGKTAKVRMTNLRKGTTKSCGCLNDEKRRSKQLPLEVRFWALVDKHGPDECWPWKGSLFLGYGNIKRKGVKMGAHRASWEIAHPDEPRLGPDDFICHKCNNPTCVNPNHLFRANIIINNFDRTIKFANKDWTFDRTENLIREIKGLRANGMRYSEIHRITGVKTACIAAILSGKYEV